MSSRTHCWHIKNYASKSVSGNGNCFDVESTARFDALGYSELDNYFTVDKKLTNRVS